ncbi:DUF2953 domain-containing protein [Scopulibacillus cellulosilyticus]|uniref:DUF2953 domain-containing protein n=1 Tax=Scopulibacillus cellulosilyticus TaxID=2665665 RepID=A0ABW2PW83_9BACL
MLMTVMVIIFSFILLLIILWFFAFISVDFKGFINECNIDAEITVKLWGLTILKKTLDDIDLNYSPFKMTLKNDNGHEQASINKEEFKSSFSKILSGFKILGDLNRRYHILKWFKVKNLSWKTKIGLDDASVTGISVGVIWMIKIQLLKLADDWLVLKKNPDIDVSPIYQSFAAESKFSCMISFRLGKAIITGYRIAKYWKRRHHPACQNIQYKA